MRLIRLLRVDILTDREERRAAFDHILRTILRLACSWVLSTFSMLQDWLLGSERFRTVLLYAFSRRFAGVMQELMRPPASNPYAFDTLEYYVDTNSKQLLQFAGLHALSVQLTAEEALAPSQLLPCVSRVLLQTEEKNSGRYLEAVASAVAASMHATLLPIDNSLLARLASVPFSAPSSSLTALGSSLGDEIGLGIDYEAGGASTASTAGGPGLRLGWEALKRAVHARETPTVMFLRRADQLLCGSMEAYEAFMEAWGSPEILALEGASRAPVVMVAGCRLVETGTGATEGSPKSEGGRGVTNGEEEGGDAEGDIMPKPAKSFLKGLFGGGDDNGLFEDDTGLGALLKELDRQPLDDKPNPRRVLPRLFPTRVKLQPPPSGPASLQHRQRMARDALESAEEDNYRAARSSAVSAGVQIPARDSGVYSCSTPLSKADWEKALAWAVTIQLVQRQQEKQQHERKRQWRHRRRGATEGEAVKKLTSDPLPSAVQQGRLLQQEEEGTESAGGSKAEAGVCNGDRTCPAGSLLSLKHLSTEWDGSVSSKGDGREGAGDSISDFSAPCTGTLLQEGGWSLESNGAGAACTGSTPSAACVPPMVRTVCRALLSLTPLPLLASGGLWLLSYTPSAVQQWAARMLGALSGLSAGAAQHDGRRLLSPSETDSAGALKGAAQQACVVTDSSLEDVPGREVEETAGRGPGGGELLLSPQAVLYGLGMLRRSGGGLKQGVRASDSYEKKLLGEVLSPEDCGSGFSEVGALQEAKAALREAVQLPLKHPHLFGGGALARPSKGLLLFGPPGTGKTLLARAAAAECGASFLGINPSSVASKWFGDGVRFIRAAFSLAEKLSPCVIFVDEVDALLGRRNSLKEHEALREMKNEFMAQWDGIKGEGSRVMVLGATNRPFDIDEAVLRRFTHRVFVGLPNKAARKQILEVILAGEALAPDVDLGRIAEMTEGYSGSDLRQLCVQAAMRPVRELLEEESRAKARRAQQGHFGKENGGQHTKGPSQHAQGDALSAGSTAQLRTEPGRVAGQQAQQPQGCQPVDQQEVLSEGQRGLADGGGREGSDFGDSEVEGQSGPVPGAGEQGVAARIDEGRRTGSTGERGKNEESEGSVSACNKGETAAAGEEEEGDGLGKSEGEGRAGGEGEAEGADVAAVFAPDQLGQLLKAAEGIAGEGGGEREELRPIRMQDFEEAQKEVTATVDPDSHVIQELNEWNQQYGTVGDRKGVSSKRLTYYL